MAQCEEYIPLEWFNNTSPAINATNLNHLEQGVKKVTDCLNQFAEETNNKFEDVNDRIDEIIGNNGNVLPGMIIAYSGTSVPPGWALCDGSNGTPDLRNRFIMGGYASDIGRTGGYLDATLPEHQHQISGDIIGGSHSHSVDLYNAVTSGEGETLSAADPTDMLFSDAPAIKDGGEHTHTHTLVCDWAGESGIGKNLPPYYQLVYLMKL